MTEPITETQGFDLVLADDDRRVLEALADMLGDHPGFRIVGTSTSGDGAAELCADTRADLAVLDVMMPSGGVDGLLAIAALSPSTRVAFYTARGDRRTRERLLEAGAVAVFAKGGPIDLAAELYATALEYCSPRLADKADIGEPPINRIQDYRKPSTHR